jgi:hypothetical protein
VIRLCSVLALLSVAACGSEPAATTGTGSGGAHQGGMGGAATGGGGSAPDLPDYRDSPCWGEVATTDVYDAAIHMVGPLQATCRAEGERVRVYVVDELWETAIDQAQVNGFVHRLELVGSPAALDSDASILTQVEALLGPLDTSLLPAGKLDVFIASFGGTFADGYYCGWCAEPQIHLDGAKVAPLNEDYALALVSHELAHVVHRVADADEESWVDEPLGEASMLANGYNIDGMWLTAYLTDPNLDWGPGGAQTVHYGGALVWGTYLLEQGGPDLLRAIVTEPGDGWAGLEAAFASSGQTAALGHYHRALLSMYFDRPDLGYGFDAIDTAVAAVATLQPGSMHQGSLAPHGVEFVALDAAGEVQIVTTPSDGSLTALAAVQAGQIVVSDVSLGGTVAVAGNPTVIAITAAAATDYSIVIQ